MRGRATPSPSTVFARPSQCERHLLFAALKTHSLEFEFTQIRPILCLEDMSNLPACSYEIVHKLQSHLPSSFQTKMHDASMCSYINGELPLRLGAAGCGWGRKLAVDQSDYSSDTTCALRICSWGNQQALLYTLTISTTPLGHRIPVWCSLRSAAACQVHHDVVVQGSMVHKLKKN
jgi:hypothetical protein